MNKKVNLISKYTNAKDNKYYKALENVIDPELHIDLVNLGLIYNINIDNNKKCTVTMTLTMMGCPLADELANNIKHQLIGFDEIDKVKINLVWSPQWSMDKMSIKAKWDLGLSIF